MFETKLLTILPILTLLNVGKARDKFGHINVIQSNQKDLIQNINREIKLRGSREYEADDEPGWSIINEEVDTVIPLVLLHVQKLHIEHLQLPDIKENLSIKPPLLEYEAGIYLTNGIVYNVAGIQRYKPAYMTYKEKSFLARFYLTIKKLQFEYNFLLKIMALEGFAQVIGTLDDTVIYTELAIDVVTFKMNLNDFHVVQFSHIQVFLDQPRFIKHLTGIILSPLTNMFKKHVTTSVSDGLKNQMQTIMDDFNSEDPLELCGFVKKILGSLTGHKN